MAAAVVVLALAAGGLYRSHRATPLTDKDSVLLADFVNTTGDAVFDGTLKQALAVQLEQSPYLNVLPESRVQRALRFMGRSSDERITNDVAREICQREGVKAMLSGSISTLGSHFVITLDALNAQTGDSLAREQVEAENKEQVLKSLDKAASQLREKLGESIGSVQKFATPLEAATTSSLDALKEFSLGQAAHSKFDDEAAIPHLQRAVELDPNFATAWAVLGVASNNIGKVKQGLESLQKAFDAKDRASEREKFYISSHYYGEYQGDVEKNIETLEQWIQAYPRDTIPRDNLALMLQDTGQQEKGLAVATEVLQLDSKNPYSYQNLSASYLYLNRYDEARAVAEQSIAQKAEPWSIHMEFYWLAYLRGDESAMQKEVTLSAGKVSEPIILYMHAEGLCAEGKIKQAREAFSRSSAAALAQNNKSWASWGHAGEALCDAETGFSGEAREAINAALALSDDRSTQEGVVRTLARIGDPRSEKIIADLSKEFPVNTMLNNVILATARALRSLQGNQPAQALAALEPAKPYDLAADRSIIATDNAMYVRGEAFLQSHDGAKAAAEFQNILNHRGLDPTSLFYSLAHLGLGRAYVLQADDAKAKLAYQDFFAVWKDADPDVPILKTAKAEYEKLK
jgi:eukaryotic-like serine/threonine-protein kinase